MYRVDVYLRVRRAVMVEGKSIREVSREFGLHRDTVRKMLAYSVPPGYRRQTPPRRPKLEPYTGVIDRILEDDLRRPRKAAPHGQAHLRAAQGLVVRVRRRIHHNKSRTTSTRASPPSDQGDVRAAVPSAGPRPVRLWRGPGGHRRRGAQGAHCFVIDLPHSDGCFVKAYPAETTEAFLDGHVAAFAFLGGVPQSILYDNTRLAVARILTRRTAASAPGPSPSSSPTTCSRTGSAAPARAMTKARWKAWSGTCAATFWCRCRPSRVSTALNDLLGAALPGADGRPRSGATTETIGQRMERDLDGPAAPASGSL